jgi:hypothetical protein
MNFRRLHTLESGATLSTKKPGILPLTTLNAALDWGKWIPSNNQPQIDTSLFAVGSNEDPRRHMTLPFPQIPFVGSTTGILFSSNPVFPTESPGHP